MELLPPGGLLLYTLAGFFLAPWLLQRTLVGTLDDRLDLQTQVEEIRINPFSMSLRVDGLSLNEADGSELMSFERLFVNFELMSLFRWAWSFNELHLINPSIEF